MKRFNLASSLLCIRLSNTRIINNIKFTLISHTFKALETSNDKSHVY
jgi:hypothetical protein